jgi:hypothetical protein
MKKKTIRRWIGGIAGSILLLLILLQATFFFFGDEILKKSILLGFERYSREAFEPSRQPSLDFENLSLNLITGNITISGLYFAGYLPTQNDGVAADYIRLEVPEARIEGVDFLSVYQERVVTLEHIRFLNPDIQLLKAEKEDSLKMDAQESIRASTASLHQLLSPYLKTFAFDRLQVQDGNLFITRQGRAPTASNQLHAEHVYISLYDFLLDSLSLENKERIFFTRHFEVQLGDYQIVTPDSSYLVRSDTLGYSSREERIYLKNLRALPLITDSSRANVRLSVPELSLTAVNWKEIYFDSLFHAEELLIERPEIALKTRYRADSLDGRFHFSLGNLSTEQLYPLLEEKFRAFSVRNLLLKEGRLRLHEDGADSIHLLTIHEIGLRLGGIRLNSSDRRDSLHQVFPADTLSLDLKKLKLYLPDRKHFLTARQASFTTSSSQDYLCQVMLDSVDIKPGYDSLEQLLLLPPQQKIAFQVHIPRMQFDGIHLEVLNEEQAFLLDSIYIHRPDVRIANFTPQSLGKQAAGLRQYDFLNDSLRVQETVKSILYDWSHARLNLRPFIAPGDSTAFLQWLHAGKLQLDSGRLEILRADTAEYAFDPVTSVDTIYTSLEDIKIDHLPDDTLWRSEVGRVAVRASEVDVFIQKGQFRLPGDNGQGGIASVEDARISTLNREIYVRNIYFWTNPGFPPNMDFWLHRMYIPFVQLKDIDLQKLYLEQVAEAQSFSAYAPRLIFNYKKSGTVRNRLAFDFENLYPQFSSYLNKIDVKWINLSRGELVIRKLDRQRVDSLFTTEQMNVELSHFYIDSLTRMTRLRPFYAHRLNLQLDNYRWNFLPEDQTQRLQGVVGESLEYDSYDGQLDAIAPRMLVNTTDDVRTDELALYAHKIMADDFDPYRLINAKKLHVGRLIVNEPYFALVENLSSTQAKAAGEQGWESLQPDMNQLLFDQLQQIDLRFVHVERGKLRYLSRAANDTLNSVRLDSVDFLAKNIRVDGSRRRHEHHILYADDVDYSLVTGPLVFNQPNKHQLRIDKATLKRRDARLTIEGLSLRPSAALLRNPEKTHLDFRSGLLALHGLDLNRAYLYGDLNIQRVLPKNTRVKVALGTNQSSGATEPASIHELFSPYIKQVTIGEVQLPQGEVVIRKKSNDEGIFASRELSVSMYDFRLNQQMLEAPASADGRIFYARDVRAKIRDYAYTTEDELYRLHADEISLATASRTLKLHKLSLKPQVHSSEYLQKQNFAFSLAEAEINQISLEGIDYAALLKQDRLHIDKIMIDEPVLDVMRDNRLPRDDSRRPPLHQQMIFSLDQQMDINQLFIRNGLVRYAERIPDSEDEGVISFEELNAEIRNISNSPSALRSGLVMEMDVNARIMGEGQLNASFSFPLDTAAMPFSVKGTLGPMDLTKLNQVMEPVAFVHVKEGFNQQMKFSFSGDDHKSEGSMEFRYNDLSVLMIDKEKGQAGLDEKLGSFLANAFVLKASNPKSVFLRIGNIVYERDPSRAMFHYWWQSLLSGIKSSVGLEKNMEKTKDFSRADGS